MEKNQIWTMLLLVVVVSVIASFATVNLTGNVIMTGNAIGDNNSTWITASWNPCLVVSGQSTCTSSISWNVYSPGNASAQIWVSTGSQNVLFACGKSGTMNATWISLNTSYTFKAYAAPSCNSTINANAALASVIVTAQVAPICTASNWFYVDSACSTYGTATRNWIKLSLCSPGVNHPATETISCTPSNVSNSSTCTSFTYSAWSACSPSGTQTRTVVSALPSGCIGGSPIVTQSCIYSGNSSTNSSYYTKTEVDTLLSVKTTKSDVLNTLNNCNIYSVAVPNANRTVIGNEICTERNAGKCIFTVNYENINYAVNSNGALAGSNAGIIQSCASGRYKSTDTVAYCCA